MGTTYGDDSVSSNAGTVSVPTRAEAFTRITPLSTQVAAEGKSKKRHRFTTKHIPEPLRARFNVKLIPLAREYIGTLSPWTVLSLGEKQMLVDKVWPQFNYTVRQNDVIFDLIDYRVQDWIAEFRKAALSALLRYFENGTSDVYDLDTPRGRSDFCRHALKRGDNKDLPLLYENYETRTGRFENPLILEVFGIVHFGVLSDIPENAQADARPVGSLIMAKLALEFALTHWRSGELDIPKGVAGYFSKDNWGNTIIFDHGVHRPVKKGTFFVNTVMAFSDEKWDRILQVAHEHWLDSQSRGEQNVSMNWEADEDEDDEFVLESGSNVPLTEPLIPTLHIYSILCIPYTCIIGHCTVVELGHYYIAS
ncbi:hypothetical protein C2E23DRAFT_948039 [Lenzites betulinus]|nr:hypothetical protein C2E23DRAFT_948039 [Lenzites betulinus]